MGKDLFDGFLLVQQLEESIKVDAISKLYAQGRQNQTAKGTGRAAPALDRAPSPAKKYELFSQEQIDEIVRLVNTDAQMKELGEKTKMTMDLAVKLNETGKTFTFSFENGRIAKVGSNGNAEFLISAPEAIWRAVFNRQIDPFVATTQKKMDLKGDFAKISKWYAPCSRIFELWHQVPVE
jgi:putative sterol carrier protein